MLLSLLSLLACADDCVVTCSKLFGDGNGECAIEVTGKTGEAGRGEMYDTCVEHCREAMHTSGVRGDYDPYDPTGSLSTFENRAEAELWVDCVDEATCDDLADDACPPVKAFR